jgi:ribosomal protein L10
VIIKQWSKILNKQEIRKKSLFLDVFNSSINTNKLSLFKFTNVGSNQVQQIRKLLFKKGGQLVIAKNVI